MTTGKTLAISHSLMFVIGFAFGKYIDHEELATYRELHESTWAKWRRRAGTATMGILLLGTTVMLVQGTGGGSNSSGGSTTKSTKA